MRPQVIKVLHVISGLGAGGAQAMLLKLLSASGPGFEHRVLALAGGGPVCERLRELDVPVTVLNMSRGPSGWLRLPRALYASPILA